MVNTKPYGWRTTEETRRLIWRYQGLLMAERCRHVTIDEALRAALEAALAAMEGK